MVLIKSLSFENTNSECKKLLGPLKVRSAPVDEWILNTMNIETRDNNTEAWIGEAISKVIRKQMF